MEYPYEFIDARLAKRERFDVNIGHQPTWALFYMKEGSFRLDMNGKTEIINSGDCVLFSDHLSFVRQVIEPIVFVYIKFQKNERSPITMPLPYGRVIIRDQARFQSSIQTYERVMDRTDALSVLYRKHLLEDILMQICHEQGWTDQPDLEQLVSICQDATVLRAVECIRQSLSSPISVSEICRAAKTNPSTLNFKFRRELQTSVGGFLIRERMRLARRLLSGTTYTISAIAQRCGYENIYYFSRAFRQHEGESPGEYRKRFF